MSKSHSSLLRLSFSTFNLAGLLRQLNKVRTVKFWNVLTVLRLLEEWGCGPWYTGALTMGISQPPPNTDTCMSEVPGSQPFNVSLSLKLVAFTLWLLTP